MTQLAIVVGYTCPLCKQRVVVLRSSKPPHDCPEVFISKCPCGFERPIRLAEIQELDVWREAAQ
jgi:hypothetical protein